MSITLNLGPNKNSYINEQDESVYTLTKKKSQIEIKPDNVNKKTYIFDRDKIWIDEFSAKYIKGFKKIREITPNKIIIEQHQCRLKYDNFGDRDFKVIKDLKVSFLQDSILINVPELLKIIDLKREILRCFKKKYVKNEAKLENTTVEKDSIDLYNNFTLSFYKLKDNDELQLNIKDHKQQSLDDFPTTIDFSKFHDKLTQLSQLVCFIQKTDKVYEEKIPNKVDSDKAKEEKTPDKAGKEKISVKSEISVGTGFLISTNLIFTNQHVASKLKSQKINISFYFENKNLTITFVYDGNCLISSSQRHTMSKNKEKSDHLDFEIIVIPEENLKKIENMKEWESVQKLACEFFHRDNIVSAVENDLANIIQYPGGGDKRIVFQRNEFIHICANTYHYSTLANPGSSGSPILSNTGKFLGYHYGECNIPHKMIKKVIKHYQSKQKHYTDRSNNKWSIENTHVSFESSLTYAITQSSFEKFIEGYQGPLNAEDETPFFYNIEFIETYKKHKYCRCGIPATQLLENAVINKILDFNKNYLVKLQMSEQPQNIQEPPHASADNNLEEKMKEAAEEAVRKVLAEKDKKNPNKYIFIVAALLVGIAAGYSIHRFKKNK